MADRGISPRVSGAVDLGSASKAWRKLYAGRIDEGTYIPGAFNKKETFTSSGTFTAPVTGTYRITLQGGGGGGAGAGTDTNNNHSSGGGGGAGGHLTFYEKLIAGTSYAFTIGAGGAGGAAGSTSTAGGNGSDGESSEIVIGNNTYTCTGGGGGSAGGYCRGGNAGNGLINSVMKSTYFPGGNGSITATGAVGGVGGGPGAYRASTSDTGANGSYGSGASGGYINFNGTGYAKGGAGGKGYIEFEYYDPSI